MGDMRAETFKRLQRTIATEVNMLEEEITEATEIEQISGDALDLVEVVLAIEEEWGTDIPDSAAASWQTVSDMVDYLVALDQV